jgi:hypothetical protein
VFLSLMAQLDKGNTATLEELLVSSLAQTRTGEALDKEGADYPRRVYAEGFQGKGTYQKLLKSS